METDDADGGGVGVLAIALASIIESDVDRGEGARWLKMNVSAYVLRLEALAALVDAASYFRFDGSDLPRPCHYSPSLRFHLATASLIVTSTGSGL